MNEKYYKEVMEKINKHESMMEELNKPKPVERITKYIEFLKGMQSHLGSSRDSCWDGEEYQWDLYDELIEYLESSQDNDIIKNVGSCGECASYENWGECRNISECGFYPESNFFCAKFERKD